MRGMGCCPELFCPLYLITLLKRLSYAMTVSFMCIYLDCYTSKSLSGKKQIKKKCVFTSILAYWCVRPKLLLLENVSA